MWWQSISLCTTLRYTLYAHLHLNYVSSTTLSYTALLCINRRLIGGVDGCVFVRQSEQRTRAKEESGRCNVILRFPIIHHPWLQQLNEAYDSKCPRGLERTMEGKKKREERLNWVSKFNQRILECGREPRCSRILFGSYPERSVAKQTPEVMSRNSSYRGWPQALCIFIIVLLRGKCQFGLRNPNHCESQKEYTRILYVNLTDSATMRKAAAAAVPISVES